VPRPSQTAQWNNAGLHWAAEQLATLAEQTRIVLRDEETLHEIHMELEELNTNAVELAMIIQQNFEELGV